MLETASRVPAALLGLEERVADGGDTVLLEEGRVVEARVAGTVVHRA